MIYETDTKNTYMYDGSVWQGETGYNGGNIIKLGANMEMAFGNQVIGTSASGDVNLVAAIIAATGWTSVYSYQVMNGDVAARTNIVINTFLTIFPVASGQIRVFTGNTGAILVSLGVRFLWIALGK
jgi:hypothetical protein